jgi:acyl-[acyl carrier protein]--UDP-N-acetylglucosamine O-acyltransferase
MKEMFNEKSDIVFNKRIENAKQKYPENSIIQEIIEFLQKDNSRTFCRYK